MARTVLARTALMLLLQGCATSAPQTVAEPFCYQWLTDILCYAESFPHSAARLLGRPRLPSEAG